ncbi:hypothetical protein CYMTET_36370, partial [Cymbomonas tetramitiformis]
VAFVYKRGLQVTHVQSVEPAWRRFDLMLEVVEEPTKYEVRWYYDVSKLGAEVVEAYATRFEVLLLAALENVVMPIGVLPLCTEMERQAILVHWNQSDVEYPPEPFTLHQLFAKHAAARPEAIAAIHRDRRATYRELQAAAGGLAGLLALKGVKPECTVGVFVHRGLEYLISILAVLISGAAYVPLDPAYPSDRIQFILEDSGCVLLMTERSLLEDQGDLGAASTLFVEEVLGGNPFSPTGGSIVAPPHAPPEVTHTPSQLAYMIYTSGTTGKPKGVAIEHRSVVNTILGVLLEPGDIGYLFFGIAFDGAVIDIFRALCAGAAIVLRTDDIIHDITTHQVTHIAFTPSTLATLDPAELPSVKGIIVAAEACTLDLVHRWAPGHVMRNLYGPTETSVAAVGSWLKETNAVVAIGRPLPNVFCVVLDSNRQLVPPGLIGELYIGGAGVARGYHKRPELTAEKFIRNPFGEGRLYASGDLVRWLPNGELEFKGRLGTQVKLRGYRIELGEVESTLTSIEGVASAVVLLRCDTSGVDHLVGYVTPAGAEVGQLFDELRRTLPAYMLPSAVVALAAFPLTPNGKIDAAKLPSADAALAAFRHSKEEANARLWSATIGQTSSLEPALLQCVSEVLGRKLEEIRADDLLADLGATSLHHMRLINRLRVLFQARLQRPPHAYMGLPPCLATLMRGIAYVPCCCSVALL